MEGKVRWVSLGGRMKVDVWSGGSKGENEEICTVLEMWAGLEMGVGVEERRFLEGWT